jgi:hypothetical protein
MVNTHGQLSQKLLIILHHWSQELPDEFNDIDEAMRLRI